MMKIRDESRRRRPWLAPRLVALLPLLLATLLLAPMPPASAQTFPIAAAPFTTPTPSFVFVPTTTTSKPLNHRQSQLDPFDYVEEEYFLSGTANLYQHDTLGNVQIASAGNPYTTRILVRRPRERHDFSGNVVVEIYNSTVGVDIDVEWTQSAAFLTRHGDIWVGITTNTGAVRTLKNFYDPTLTPPTRYAPINLTDNGLAWDAVSQLGVLLKSNQQNNFLPGYKVRRVYAMGESSSGQALVLYINEIHPFTRLPGGRPIYDGFVPSERFGSGNAFNSSGSSAAAAFPTCDPHLVLHSEVPIINLQTQTEIVGNSEYCVRRADGDAPGDRYRLWELAGSPHLTPFVDADDNTHRDLAGTPYVFDSALCTNSKSENTFPKEAFLQSALSDLYAWVDFGWAPPKADRISLSATTPPVIELDSFGNALGGLRTPFVDVPIATYFASDTLVKGNGPIGFVFCSIFGYTVPFTNQQLQSLYTTHDQYEDAVEREADQLVRARFLLRENADDIVRQAELTDVP